MTRICNCPRDGAIPNVPDPACKFRVGQIQKAALQRLMKDSSTQNSFPMTGAGAVGLLASWNVLIEATDNTKVQITPYINNPVTEAGDPITFGGGNATLGGREIILGRGASTFTGEFHNIEQTIISALKNYECELDEDLGIYLFMPGNKMLARVVEDTTTNTPHVYPIPIGSFFIGDLVLGGLESPDMNTFQWQFDPDWSDNVAVVSLEFNPLRDLKNGN